VTSCQVKLVTVLPGDLAIARCRYRVMLARMLSSHAGDNIARATWPWHDVDVESCWWQSCRGDLAVTRCRCQIMLLTMLPSHAGDDAAGATWPRYDVDAESCWRQSYRGDLTII
jgi:hypothetical protein